MSKSKKKLARKSAQTKREKETSISPAIEDEQANSTSATLTIEGEQAKDASAIKGEPMPETSAPVAQEIAPSETAPVPKHRGRKAKTETSTDAEPAPKRRTKKTNVEKIAAEQPVRRLARKEKADVPDKAEETTVVQYEGQDFNVAELKERVIAAYVEAGHRRGRISKLNIYIKPEDHKAYYVINEKTTGSIDF